MTVTTPAASLGQLAVHADLITREQCQELRRYQRQRTAGGRPISFARMLLAAGVSSRQLRRLLRKGADLETVLCDACGAGIPQAELRARREVPCPECDALVMPFRPFALSPKKPRQLNETHAYDDVLPIPQAKRRGTNRYDEVLVAPLDEEPTLHFREVLSLPTRSESETLTAFRSLIESESGSDTAPLPRGEPRPDPSLEIKQIGPFVLERLLGKGSIGEVYLGRHQETKQHAAVKVLSRESAGDEEFLKRFQREARATAKIQHPNLVRPIEAGFDDALGLHYLGMEYLSRGSLGELLKHTPILLERRALEIARDVLQALVAASEAGIIHRDVKPHNVLFDTSGVAKLADLGLAMDIGDESRITATGVVVGTPLYIAPEQASGEPVDARADLYALGLCLYEMLTGKQPFAEDGAPPIEIIVRHLKEELGDVRLMNPDVSDNAAQLVRGLCSRDPSQRYVNPSAALRDFILVLDGHSPLGTGETSPASALTDPTVRVKLPADNHPALRPSQAPPPEPPARSVPLAILVIGVFLSVIALSYGLFVLLAAE